MKSKHKLSKLIGLRMKKDEYGLIEREAESKGLDVVSYLRMLIKTHPDRGQAGD